MDQGSVIRAGAGATLYSGDVFPGKIAFVFVIVKFVSSFVNTNRHHSPRDKFILFLGIIQMRKIAINSKVLGWQKHAGPYKNPFVWFVLFVFFEVSSSGFAL